MARSTVIRMQANPRVEAAEHPTGVAGEFNAHFENGHVIGALGATR